MANFKAYEINKLIKEHDLSTCIEFGCGDGNQLQYFQVEDYLGLDVSKTAVNMCKKKYALDTSKKFKLVKEYSGEKAELVLSLEVLFHIVEHNLWEKYIFQLFDAATNFVVIFSANIDSGDYAEHIKVRKFTDFINKNISDFTLYKKIESPLHLVKDSVKSDFYIYKHKDA